MANNTKEHVTPTDDQKDAWIVKAAADWEYIAHDYIQITREGKKFV